MSDLKIDARLKEINIKIRAMEGEQTRRRLEASNGLNDELHAIDDKFHEDMKNLKEKYMQERQSIEDRYFADRKAIDKEYEDKRLDLIDSIKEVIGDISEVVGFESSKPVQPVANFSNFDANYSSYNNEYNSISENVEPQMPLTSLSDIENSLDEITNNLDNVEPNIDSLNIPVMDSVSNVDQNIQSPVDYNGVNNQNNMDVMNQVQNTTLEPITETFNQVEPIIQNVVPTPETVVSEVSTQSPMIDMPQSIPTIDATIQQQVAPTFEQNVVQDINTSIDNVLDDINSNVN